MAKWIRTQDSRLVNIELFPEVRVCGDRDHHGKDYWILSAREPFYTDSSCNSITLAKFTSKAEATEALNDLYDWLRDEQVGSDFTATARN